MKRFSYQFIDHTHVVVDFKTDHMARFETKATAQWSAKYFNNSTHEPIGWIWVPIPSIGTQPLSVLKEVGLI